MSSEETAVRAEATFSHFYNLIRPLGALEEIMWLLDQSSPVHFALVAEIGGYTKVEE
jgi:hypothetical protein